MAPKMERFHCQVICAACADLSFVFIISISELSASSDELGSHGMLQITEGEWVVQVEFILLIVLKVKTEDYFDSPWEDRVLREIVEASP